MQGTLSIVANWCSIVGVVSVPAVALTLWQVYRQRRELAEARSRAAYADMVKFRDVQAGDGVTIAPFKQMPFLPRVGERLTLPLTPDGLRCGDYRVLDIHYVCFADADSEDAQLINVRIDVVPIEKESKMTILPDSQWGSR